MRGSHACLPVTKVLRLYSPARAPIGAVTEHHLCRAARGACSSRCDQNHRATTATAGQDLRADLLSLSLLSHFLQKGLESRTGSEKQAPDGLSAFAKHCAVILGSVPVLVLSQEHLDTR